MTKSVFFGVSLFLCASLAFAGNVRVKATKANVRSEPNLTSRVVGTVVRGDTLEVLESSRDWIKVKGQRFTGWISNKLVEEVAGPASTAPAGKGASAGTSGGEAKAAPAEARPSEGHATTGEKLLSYGGGASFANKDVGFGLDGRVVVRPLKSYPALRALGAFDYFFKEGRGWKLTANAVYALGRPGADVRPYGGGGLMYSHASGASATDLDLTAGVEYRQRFFAEARVVFDPTVFIVSAGVTF